MLPAKTPSLNVNLPLTAYLPPSILGASTIFLLESPITKVPLLVIAVSLLLLILLPAVALIINIPPSTIVIGAFITISYPPKSRLIFLSMLTFVEVSFASFKTLTVAFSFIASSSLL